MLAVVVALPALLLGGVSTYLHLQQWSWQRPPLAEQFAGRPLPMERDLTLTSGRVLHVAEYGPDMGPVIVMLHGSPGGWSDFTMLMTQERLGTSARLVAVDRLGWGGSREGGIETSLVVQAAAIAELLATYPADRRVVLVGSSWGGAVAARVAMDRPDLGDALLLLGASVDPALHGDDHVLNALGSNPWINWAIPEAYRHSSTELLPIREQLAAMQEQWGTIRCPVTMLYGADDTNEPRANADLVVRALGSRVTVQIVPGSGHGIQWDKPEVVADAILALLT